MEPQASRKRRVVEKPDTNGDMPLIIIDQPNSLSKRNKAIFEGYKNGISVEQLATEYYLSPKTVYKILSEMVNNR